MLRGDFSDGGSCCVSWLPQSSLCPERRNNTPERKPLKCVNASRVMARVDSCDFSLALQQVDIYIHRK